MFILLTLLAGGDLCYRSLLILDFGSRNEILVNSTITLQKPIPSLRSTPFRDFISQFDNENTSRWELEEYEEFLQGVQEFSYQEPLIAANVSCRPAPMPDHVDCQRPGFPGSPRAAPVKIGHAIQFGFDIDTLEIHLHELYDVVDKFFIVEMTTPHNKLMTTKTLSWDHVKMQKRFRHVRDKVVHFVLDDLDVATMNGPKSESIWVAESFQEKRRWEKIRDWNNQTRFFSEQDVIGFGDTDEIASREAIHVLKKCSFVNIESVDIGIWFPFGRIDQAFSTDWPVKGRRYSLGDPTFWTFQSARSKGEKGGTPSRNRGTSGHYILGGMHMTHYGYLPYQIVKQFAMTESTSVFQKIVLDLVEASTTQDGLKEMSEKMSVGYYPKRIKKIAQIAPRELEGIVYLPWFYDCNRDRYPRWEGKLDSRLGL